MLDSLYPVRDKILDHANMGEGNVLLDVGCGDGLIAFGALEKVKTSRVIFSDISQDLLNQALQPGFIATELSIKLVPLHPSDTVLPVLQGRLKGKRWIVGSSNHGCWLGSFEYDKRRAFEAMVQPGGMVRSKPSSS